MRPHPAHEPEPEQAERRRIRVTGTVQGVGFRPFVFRQAVQFGLDGWVRNDSAGVLIEVEGDPALLDRLVEVLADDPPPLARVESVSVDVGLPPIGSGGFRIAPTDADGMARAPVGVDSATCAACLAEVLDPNDRRHRYPFTNCTNCGPRYTIVQRVPYDRPGHHHGDVHDVRGVPGRVRRSARSSLPRPTERMPGLWTAPHVAPSGRLARVDR